MLFDRLFCFCLIGLGLLAVAVVLLFVRGWCFVALGGCFGYSGV